MADDTLIWPANLHHLCLTTGQRPKMIEWYRDTMGLTPEETVDGMTWMRGSQRNLLLQDGEAGEVAFIGLEVANTAHLERLRVHVEAENIPSHPYTRQCFETTASPLLIPMDIRSFLVSLKILWALSTPDPGVCNMSYLLLLI